MKPDSLLRQAASRTADCPPLDQLDSFAAHVGSCAHCQAEAALLVSFDNAVPTEAEAADTQWIVNRVSEARHKAEPSVPFWRRWFSGSPWPAAAVALASVLMITAGFLEFRRQDPPLVGGDGPAVWRATGQLEVTSPQGDLKEAPEQWAWKPVAGAARYEITIKEVDGTVVWQTATGDTGVSIDPAARGRMVRLKPLLVQVQAFSVQQKLLADSGPIRIRVF